MIVMCRRETAAGSRRGAAGALEAARGPRRGAAGALATAALVSSFVAAGPVPDSNPGLPGTRPVPGAPPQAGAGRQAPDVPYNGAFTFTRIRYGGGRSGYGWGRGSSAWAHDYPDADRNIQTILDEFTSMAPNTSGSNVLDLEDPELFRHPSIYMSEPGFWTITDEGARNLRAFLLKGGFLVFDDFEGSQWYNMAAQVARALPEGVWVEIDGTHPIFQQFFTVEDIYVPHPLVNVTPVYRAIFEDNDPSGRIMVLANHNSDLAEYWEWSPTGYFPVDPTNDAYRLGVNYVIYGVTH